MGLAVDWNPIVYIMSIVNHLSYIVDQNLSKITVGWALSRSLTLLTPQCSNGVSKTQLCADDWRHIQRNSSSCLEGVKSSTNKQLNGPPACPWTRWDNVSAWTWWRSFIPHYSHWIKCCPQETSQALKNLERCMMYHCSTALVSWTVGTISAR